VDKTESEDLLKLPLVLSEKTGELEVEPAFSKEEVVFHPVPKAFQKQYKAGDVVTGRFGVIRNTGKKDKRGVPICIQYFIPV
jgi:hypothetical protein